MTDRAAATRYARALLDVTLADDEKRRWIDGLPDIAGRWVASAEQRGHPAGEVLRVYMAAIRERGGQPLRDWDQAQ